MRATAFVSCALVAVTAVRHDAGASATESLVLPASVLATPPDVLVALAEQAIAAITHAERLRDTLGKRPRLDVDAEHAAIGEWEALQQDRLAAAAAKADRLRLISMANGAGLGWLAAAAGMAVVARQPLGPTIDLAVALAATSPVAGYLAASTRARRARAAVAQRRQTCAEALERAGAKTMGELRARRVVVDSWARRRDAARIAAKQANDALTAWYEVAGRELEPEEVGLLVERCAELRREALDRMRELLVAHRDARAAAGEAEGSHVVVPFREQLKALPPGGRVGAGLERLHGLRLRLWRSA